MNTRSRALGFSLVEVTLALGVAAFCMVTLLGLLPVGLNSNQAAIEQTVAAGIAGSIASDLRATPLATSSNTAPLSPRFFIPLPSPSTTLVSHTLFLTEDGSPATATPTTSIVDKDANPAQLPVYRATVFFPAVPTGASPATDRTATVARLLVTWPALADSKWMNPPSQFTGSVETIIALDRN
jgi:Tfp pilus assembly protein PilV